MSFEDNARSKNTHIMCCGTVACDLVDCTKLSIENFVSLFGTRSLSTLEMKRKFWGQPTKLHGVTCQKIVILMLVKLRNSNFTNSSLVTTFLKPYFINQIITDNVVIRQHTLHVYGLSSRYFENSL
jgi:hypothetical protein